jgi:protein TonB
MRSLDPDDRFAPRDPSWRVTGLVIVIALHAVIGYALVSGMARQGLNFIKKPLEAVVIQEVIIPPPHPPPKKVDKLPVAPRVQAPPLPYVPPPDVPPQVISSAPVIAAAATPPEPVAIAPPPPAPLPVAIGPKRASIGLVCPRQVAPEMPRRALRDGIEGVVKAQILVREGKIVEVTILSGPSVFHAAVKAAIMQYTCVTEGDEVIATQVFNFKLE